MRPRLPGASGVSPYLLFLVFLSRSWAEPPTWLPATSVVPAPTNVEIKSYNLNPQVFWNYSLMSPPPNFTVELKDYEEGKWIEVCTNISEHFCNIFEHVKSPDLSYWARVKATIGQKESSFADSPVFRMCKQGKIGPPKLKVQMKDHQLIVDISHPLIIVENKKKGIVYDHYEDECSMFSYKVYWKINGSMEASTEYIQIIEEEDDNQPCNETQCQLIIPGASFNSEYCVSAEGFSQNSAIWSFKFEKSEELCIKTPTEKEKDTSVLILIISLSLISIVCLLVPVLICRVRKRKTCQRENFTLPKSLVVTVVRNFNSLNLLEVKPEGKYISIVETSDLKAPESEEKAIAHLTPVSSINSEDNREKDHFQEISSKTEEMTIEENVTEMISDSHQSTMMKENYFHPISSQTESGSLISNSCLPGDDSENRHEESCNSMSHPESPQSDPETWADIQDNIAIRKVNTTFGYDKPHVLVDMLTDTNDKETLIGYRPGPEPSVEIS
ncbi:interferon gamma receptor 1 [Gracilinanus agilis]|uniref:interferon gamma receptor 1 n=1 Tax=Gracilinanus agilis TaxID=191870 RepID=UPI001CFD5CF5|nr:interferon gamma receptor 1 [Gracilinanus agilis]